MHSTSRRSFLKRVAGAGAALAAAPGIVRSASPNSRPVFAFVGTGGMGGVQMATFGKLGVDCVCFSDVDKGQWKDAAKLWPRAKGYQDYREMFDKHAREIDAVTVGTPDHHHFPATILAMKAGKHVYTQKPLTHTVWEARQLTLAARKFRVATQMGNQGHAGDGWRRVVEWFRSGMIGEVTEVHTWTNRPIWPQGIARPNGSDPVPENLNWDCWIGAAPMRPFKDRVYHPFKWRGWWDFGAGALGDMACHTMDGLFWALEPGYPTAVEPLKMSQPTDETFPMQSVIKWEFPRTNRNPPFVSYWYDGGLKPERPADLEEDRNLPETGNLFVGTKATIMVSGDYGDTPRLIPEAKAKQMGSAPRTIERSPGHYEEFLMAVKGEKPIEYPKSNFLYAGPMCETILLGNVALKVGRRIEWDGQAFKITNIPEANKYIRMEYRKGWEFAL